MFIQDKGFFYFVFEKVLLILHLFIAIGTRQITFIMKSLPFETIISVTDAYAMHKMNGCIFVDCSYSIQDPDWGYKSYLESHLPEAFFVNLNTDMSSEVIPGETGRHPLPSEAQVNELIQRLGIKPTTQIIAYDQQNGASAAARFWWLLKWAGHTSVAVLQGGKKAWGVQYPLTSEIPSLPTPSFYPLNFDNRLWVDARFILNDLPHNTYTKIDARAANRYRGETEPIDPIAGHIPGAKNVPYLELQDENGNPYFKESIRQIFNSVTNTTPENQIFYCGSGVTACFNILLYQYAFGGKLPKLYPGSWSDWVANYPEKPIETNLL